MASAPHTFRIRADHPSLPGHFPGNPVVPGVVLLDQVALALQQQGLRLAGLSQVKFASPLLPEQDARLELDLASERLRFRVWRDDALIASGEAAIA